MLCERSPGAGSPVEIRLAGNYLYWAHLDSDWVLTGNHPQVDSPWLPEARPDRLSQRIHSQKISTRSGVGFCRSKTGTSITDQSSCHLCRNAAHSVQKPPRDRQMLARTH